MATATTLQNVFVQTGTVPYVTALNGGADAQATGVAITSFVTQVIPADSSHLAYALPVSPVGTQFIVQNAAASALTVKVYCASGGSMLTGGALTANGSASIAQNKTAVFTSFGDGGYAAVIAA